MTAISSVLPLLYHIYIQKQPLRLMFESEELWGPNRVLFVLTHSQYTWDPWNTICIHQNEWGISISSFLSLLYHINKQPLDIQRVKKCLIFLNTYDNSTKDGRRMAKMIVPIIIPHQQALQILNQHLTQSLPIVLLCQYVSMVVFQCFSVKGRKV